MKPKNLRILSRWRTTKGGPKT